MLLPRQAIAAGAVVGQNGETLALTRARVAVAVAPGQRTLWAQVSVSGAQAGFAWIMPVGPGGRVDLGSDAWLDALDAATSPVVLSPWASSSVTACDDAGATQVVAPETSPLSTKPSQTGVFTDLASLSAFVEGAGYTLPGDLAGKLGALFGSGSAVVAATYASAALPTRTLRIVDDGPPVLPLALSGGAASDTPVTAFVVAAAAATAGTSPFTGVPFPVVWLGGGTSTYVSERDTLLASWQGARWYTETASPDVLFEGTVTGLGIALPSVAAAYSSLATAYGDVVDGTAPCVAPSSDACPPGALGIAPGRGPCSLAPEGGDEAGEVGNDAGEEDALGEGAVACASAASDMALALTSMPADGVWISRIDGLLTSTSAADVPLSIQPMPAQSPLRAATGGNATCEGPPSAPIPTLALPSASPTGSAGYGVPAEHPDPGAGATATAAAEGCGAAADSCGNSGDPSEEGDAGGGCGSASPTDGGGDASSGCDSSGDDCATARARGRRSPVSRAIVLLAAAAVVARRRARRA